ncbi:DsbA family protein [Pseudonocardia sp. HH130630-07]|uniref:DsbA family protein n=1 Tax=Pseudonocardia sp. HH130630-07 TaxID=1690815 RepID=UPI000814F228|nr:DsbA family protein [Pseudonocardia sp. HH130630-07]ANY05579.1 cyclic nucleotide-binding protein [Pseudonocardia sp. HH130630-07]
MSRLDPPVGPYDHVLGAPGAELTLVEYGDYECPYCRDAAPVIDEVRARLGERLRFVFRHFPLHEVHPHAIAAALAAEMAAREGRFWEMHAALFAPGPPRLGQDDLRAHARTAGARPDQVIWPATRAVEDRIEAGFNAAVRGGVRGTPTLYVNGERYRGEVTVDALAAALEPADAR